MKIYWTKTISASHQLNLPYASKCNNLHGHNYKIEVWLDGELNGQKMIMDFSSIKEVVFKYDHQHLNDFFTPTTAEMFANVLLEKLTETMSENIKSAKVRVWETGDTYAEAEM